jgi:hypothetical protein
MIRIRYTAPREIELAADRPGLDFISFSVSEARSTPGGAARILVQPVPDPSPYATALQMLRIRADDGLLHILVLGQHLIVTGNSEALELFERTIQASALGPPGKHIHLEYYEGHPKIDPRSLPLVVMHERP